MKLCANACGDCRRCRDLKKLIATAKLAREALVLLEACDWALAADLQSVDESDVRSHPNLRRKLGLRTRIARLARQLPPS